MQESVKFDKELKEAIKVSITTMAKAVKSTLGPEGTNSLILTPGGLPTIVNDGVRVAKAFMQTLAENHPKELTTKITQILNTVPTKTEEIAGDSTSTSVTLLESILLEGLKYSDDYSSMNMVKGIKLATKDILSKIDSKAIPIAGNTNLLAQVASISANNDKELGEIIAEAFLEVGVDGQIEVKDSKTGETNIEIVKGMKYNSGFESELFVNAPLTRTSEYKNAKILIYEGKFSEITESFLKTTKELNVQENPLIIIADEYSTEVMNILVNSKINQNFKICALRSPNYGQAKAWDLDDIAFVTGAKVIASRFGNSLNDLTLDMLGEVENIKITSNSFSITIKKEKDQEIAQRVSDLKVKKDALESEVDREEYVSRIARLSMGVAVLYVAGDSPIQISEKKLRIEDAINATRSALEEGILPGGGVTLLKLAEQTEIPNLENEAQEIGYKVLLKALKAPIETICYNAEVSSDIIKKDIIAHKEFNYGYDAKDKEYTNLVDKGVIDPVKGVKAALAEASSVAQMMLTLNCAII